MYEGTLPDAIMMTSPSCFRNAVVTNTVNIKFGSMDSRNSPASTTSKGSLARSTSRNSSMTKKKMSTTPKAQTKFGLAAARRQASIEKNKQDLNLQINSKPYLKQNTEKSYKTMEPPKCKAYKAPPMPKKTVPSLSNFDPGTNQPAAKRGELSCRVSGSNTKLAEGTQESSSTSPLKSKNLDQGVHKDKQLSGLLTLCKQVDMKHGISNSIDSNFNNGNLFDEIREVDGEGDLTEKDLTIEISEVIENKKVISHADRSILGYMQDEKALEVVMPLFTAIQV